MLAQGNDRSVTGNVTDQEDILPSMLTCLAALTETADPNMRNDVETLLPKIMHVSQKEVQNPDISNTVERLYGQLHSTDEKLIQAIGVATDKCFHRDLLPIVASYLTFPLISHEAACSKVKAYQDKPEIIFGLLKKLYGKKMAQSIFILYLKDQVSYHDHSSKALQNEYGGEIFQQLPDLLGRVIRLRLEKKSAVSGIAYYAITYSRNPRQFPEDAALDLSNSPLMYADIRLMTFLRTKFVGADLSHVLAMTAGFLGVDFRGADTQGMEYSPLTYFGGTIFQDSGKNYITYCDGNASTTFIGLLRHIYLQRWLVNRSHRDVVEDFLKTASSDQPVQNLIDELFKKIRQPINKDGKLYDICLFCLKYDPKVENPEATMKSLLDGSFKPAAATSAAHSSRHTSASTSSGGSSVCGSVLSPS